MTSSVIDLDDTDRALLRELVMDGTVGGGAWAEAGPVQPAAWRRMRRLEEAGVLTGLAVEVDRESWGLASRCFWG